MIGINILLADNPEILGDQPFQPDSKTLPLVREFFSQPTVTGHPPTLHVECILPYPDYPVKVYPGQRFQWLLEGNIYNFTIQEVQIKLEECFISEFPDIQKLQSLVSSLSGEFLMMIRTPLHLYILNDAFGRLPVYTTSSRGFTFFGRSLEWLHHHVKLSLDKTAVFEYLWCSYPLHFKTLYRDVYRYKGGSITGINLQTQAVTVYPGSTFNFDERNDFDPEVNSKRVSSLFLQASQRIVSHSDHWPVNLSLSGGLDSRAVAYGLNYHAANMSASGFLYPGAEDDVVVAEKVATLIGIPWKKYTVARSIQNDNELLHMKMGLNYIGLSFLLDYFKQLRTDHPKGFLLVTGDGGDKVLPYLGEVNAQLSFDQLVQKTAHRNTVIPISILNKILGWTEDEFLHHLAVVLNTYPEKSSNNKSIHFALYEKVHQSFFEGEDRNRHFFWSTTPFYDLDLFAYAMKIPDHQKRYYRLYRHFMNDLSPTLAKLPNDTGTHMHHPRFIAGKMFHELFRATSPEIKTFLKRQTGKSRVVNAVELAERQICLELISGNPDLEALIDTDHLKSLLRIANSEQYAYVLTLSQLAKVL
ncbi:MAG TPA: hypothetical protein PLV75_05730 [Saprospiraceae bacterium]|nr:hypothetical protein [Saprospiraceae bacterium]